MRRQLYYTMKESQLESISAHIQKRSVIWNVNIDKGKLHNLSFICPLIVCAAKLNRLTFRLISQIWSEVWALPQPCSLLWCRLCFRWALRPVWWRVWSRPSIFWQVNTTRLYLTSSLTCCRQRRRTDRGAHRPEVTEVVESNKVLFLTQLGRPGGPCLYSEVCK